MQRTYCVYILANRTRRLYTGVTNHLLRRLGEHRAGIRSVFAHRYNIYRLVYFETSNDVNAAIRREKQIKSWRREKKVSLIEERNPNWEDLARDCEPNRVRLSYRVTDSSAPKVRASE
jgi:putative endonuclease